MLHGSPPRSAHRAAPDGPLAVLIRHTALIRQTAAGVTAPRRAVPRRRASRASNRSLSRLMTALAAMVAAGVCGLAVFAVIAREQAGLATPGASAPDDRTISSRTVDSRPLTLPEVFPDASIRLTAGAAPYTIGTTHVDTDCGIATIGTVGPLLDDQDCTQVVRAALTAPYGGYRVTAGVFNLRDSFGAQEVDRRLRAEVEGGTGTFGVLGGNPLADARSPGAQVGWHVRGHYLLYCVISKPDDSVLAADDPYARRITADLVDTYLAGGVMARRAG